MVGPGCWDPPADPPAWLDDIERPLVLVSTCSELQDDGRLVRTALDALAGEDVEVAATLPCAQLPGAVPPNPRVEGFVPHAPLLERAACAITHGGAGATQKALAAGYRCVSSRSGAISSRSHVGWTWPMQGRAYRRRG